jgi:Fe-S-cluster containining protein
MTMTAPYANAPTSGEIIPRTEAVIKIWDKASANERVLLGQMHQHYENEVRRIVDEGNEPHNIAHTLHGLVDESVKDTLATHPEGRNVSCKRGCGACCSLFVNITREEAQLLLLVMERDGIQIGWRRLQRQAQWNLKQWGEQPLAERRCAFLSEGNECRIYEHRPTTCRKYMVVSPAKRCDTVRHPAGQVQFLAPIDAEILASATLGVLESGSMPRMLLQAKEAATLGAAGDQHGG